MVRCMTARIATRRIDVANGGQVKFEQLDPIAPDGVVQLRENKITLARIEAHGYFGWTVVPVRLAVPVERNPFGMLMADTAL